jgi:hypothetical protein
VTTRITIKDIDCYGNLNNSDTIIVCDELDAHILSNWNEIKDRQFKNWAETIDYMNNNHNWFGDIQEISAE